MSSRIILMADNNRDFLDNRCEFLEQAGFTVITTKNPTDTERILEREAVDLAILDIRMTDDDDPEDISGLVLARKFGQKLPIIILTGFPTWENVKTAIGRDLNGLSTAVDFISKQEGPKMMIEAVNLTLEHPILKRNVLCEFQADSTQDLHETLQKKKIDESADKFQKVLERTERDLLQNRKEISQQSERAQKVAILMGLVGIGVIVIGLLLVYLGRTPLAILSGSASVVIDAISVLFITRAVQFSKQVDKKYKELQKIYRASHVYSICDTIESKSKRDDAKVLLIEKLMGKWFD